MAYREKVSSTDTKITGRKAVAPIDSWPVTSIFFGYNATNPATLLGGGTWVQIAQGQMLVGQNPADVDFDTLGDTGGEKRHTLIPSEMPGHSHGPGTYGTGSTGSGHTHGFNFRSLATTNTTGGSAVRVTDIQNALGSSGAATAVDTNTSGSGHTHDVNGNSGSTGGDNSHQNMPPYLTVYIWRRTA